MVQSEGQQQYFYGTGKRKTAIAQVRLYPGDGRVPTVNDKPLEQYFNWQPWLTTVNEPFAVTETGGQFRLVARVAGGGVNAQAEAIRHGIARALVVYNGELKAALRRRGLVTRDARIKESKKYGLKRARRAPQYTKR